MAHQQRAIAAGARWLVYGNRCHVARVELSGGRQLGAIESDPEYGAIVALAISPDDRLLAIGTETGAVLVANVP